MRRAAEDVPLYADEAFYAQIRHYACYVERRALKITLFSR